MNLAADTLLLLCSLSVQMQFISKAILYGRVGVYLFPDDVRLREIYAYSLLLDGKIEEASHIVSEMSEETRNIAYLKSRIGLLEPDDISNAREQLRLYLRMEK